MSDTMRTRLELDIAIGLLVVAGWALTAMTVSAEAAAVLPVADAQTLAGMSPSALLALVAILALSLCGYLIRLLFGRLLAVLDANAHANADLARLLAERPCIRRAENN